MVYHTVTLCRRPRYSCTGLHAAHFFFSSRRRHTRCLSDWSSDVCSSDLGRSLSFRRSTINFAGTFGRSKFVAPIILKIAGRTNCKNVTKAETGFPGNPNTAHSPIRPKTNGLPGLIATLQMSIFAPSDRNVDWTKSCSPTETPPLIMRIECLVACSRVFLNESASSLQCPTDFTTAPQRCSNACNRTELLS